MTHTAISHREQNQLLAAMPFDDWRYIESHLEWVEMPAHSTLFEAGSSLRHVYFPTTAVVSLVSTMLDGATVEVLKPAAAGGERGQIVVGRGHDPHVDPDRTGGADAGDLAILDRAQQPLLRAHGERAQFVEE